MDELTVPQCDQRRTHKEQPLTRHIFPQTSQSSPNRAESTQQATLWRRKKLPRCNVAARRGFFMKSLLHFLQISRKCQLFVATEYIVKTAFNNDSDYIMSVRKYCQFFMHESNTFMFLKIHSKTSVKLTGTTPPQTFPFPWDIWTLV